MDQYSYIMHGTTADWGICASPPEYRKAFKNGDGSACRVGGVFAVGRGKVMVGGFKRLLSMIA